MTRPEKHRRGPPKTKWEDYKCENEQVALDVQAVRKAHTIQLKPYRITFGGALPQHLKVPVGNELLI